ncbi:MAG: HIT family protein [Cyclobacteriaceae bacterium]|nr:HIT family protein [Cyclobacteriaceae bacterium]
MASIFTKIIARQIPAHIVAEDENNIAFLDINPLTVGHTLVVPKKEEDYLFDLDDDQYTALHLFAKSVAKAINKVTGKRIGVEVIGLEVPHAHIHLIPFTTMSELSFENEKLKLNDDVLAELATNIKNAISESNPRIGSV